MNNKRYWLLSTACLLALLTRCADDEYNKPYVPTVENPAYIRVIGMLNSSPPPISTTVSNQNFVLKFDGLYNTHISSLPAEYAVDALGDFLLSSYLSGESYALDINVTPSVPGVYYNAPSSEGAYFLSSLSSFPDKSHRLLRVAPVFNGNDYYKWAAVPSGNRNVSLQNALTFYQGVLGEDFTNLPELTALSSQVIEVTDQKNLADIGYVPIIKTGLGEEFASTDFRFEPGSVNTLVYANVNRPEEPYALKILKVEEPTGKVFETSKAYLRLFNFCYYTGDTEVDNDTESLDVYMAKVDSINAETQTVFSYADTVLIARDLKRFSTVGMEDYFELDMSGLIDLAKTDLDSAEGQYMPYSFLFYRSGTSPEAGNKPVFQIFDQNDLCYPGLERNFPGYAYSGALDGVGYLTGFPTFLAKTTTQLVPLIMNVFFRTEVDPGFGSTVIRYHAYFIEPVWQRSEYFGR